MCPHVNVHNIVTMEDVQSKIAIYLFFLYIYMCVCLYKVNYILVRVDKGLPFDYFVL